MKPVITEFDPAAYLDSDDAIREYLSQVLADGDTDELIRAVRYVERARDMAQNAKGLGIELHTSELRVSTMNKHIGSNFDDFLSEQGFLEDASAVALKRLIAKVIAES